MDLAEKEFVQVGRLDEREITTSLGKRLLMILSPFGMLTTCQGKDADCQVFMQTTPITPDPELQVVRLQRPLDKAKTQTEVSSLHWIPLPSLTPPFSSEQWSHIPIDISTRLSPRNQLVQRALRSMVGTME